MSNEVRKVNIYNYESQSINEIDFFVIHHLYIQFIYARKTKEPKK